MDTREPTVVTNWPDALAIANGYAACKGVRHRVRRNWIGLWLVTEVRP